MDDFATQSGDNWEARPNVGGVAKCVPWAKGASMVVELKIGENEWTSFMADILPNGDG